MSNPTKDQIRDWIRDNPNLVSKRDVAKAFGIKGADRIELKRILRELEADGEIRRDRKTLRDPETLPPVAVLRVAGMDADGDVLAEPVEWTGAGPVPRILMTATSDGPTLGPGDRILARCTAVDDPDISHQGRLIRRIGLAPSKILGIFRQGREEHRILPIDKKADREWRVMPGDRGAARDGELVEAERVGPKTRMGLPKARITSRLGDPSQAKSVSLIAIHEQGIPDAFETATLEEAEAAKPVDLGNRTDLRDLPLVTIDPHDARDHDDAVCALSDGEGWKVWVAIADVAHYVRPGSELDREARRRGNSTYFPDRVVPMLPDGLSGDLCSLHEGVDRPCIAVEMSIATDGTKSSHRFVRGLMRSPASLSYEQAQAAADGAEDLPDAITTAVRTLFAAWRVMGQERDRRQPLNLELPERKIVLSDTGQVTSVAFRDRFDAHKVIEDCMVLANVCAAQTLEAKRTPLLYRVHEEPAPEKLEALRETAQAASLTMAKGQVLTTRNLNRLLDQAAGKDEAELINLSVLRSMTQAYYAPQNFGHFGLALKSYAHFTSPIRRYADLIVHRALISAHGWGEDGLSTFDIENLTSTAEAISQTERRSMTAERDTNDRYLAAYLADRVGNEFTGKISGIARFGLFVRLQDTGADGLIPISSIGQEYFHYDRDSQTLAGDQTGLTIGIGQPVLVRLAEATPITGGLLLELLELDGKALPRSATKPRRGKPAKRKLTKAKTKRRKVRKRA